MLISDNYRQLNAEMHAAKPQYGASGGKSARMVLDLVRRYKAKTVLDYGCGKGTLRPTIDYAVEVREYDPAVKAKEAAPAMADLVVCTDVLEHIEMECLDAVLDDIRRCTGKAAYLAVHLRESAKHLPDGRNAHILLRPYRWWLERIVARWELSVFTRSDNGIGVVVEP